MCQTLVLEWLDALEGLFLSPSTAVAASGEANAGGIKITRGLKCPRMVPAAAIPKWAKGCETLRVQNHFGQG